MKKILIVLFIVVGVLSSSIDAFAQSYAINLKATMLQNLGMFPKGSEHTFVWLHHYTKQGYYSTNDNVYGVKDIFVLEDSEGHELEITSRVGTAIKFENNDIADFWDATIISNCLSFTSKYGTKYEMRAEMELDALDYIRCLQENELLFNDPYLETYIYSLVAKIAPAYFIDGRSGNINIVIAQNHQLNACCYPNGTIVLNTGLLAKLHSEDELVAILAHEIAHFVLDHSIQNVVKMEQRQKRAEFWAALATGIAAIGEVAIASSSDYYVPGAMTLGVAEASVGIASQVVERLGMEYSHEQEDEADAIARELISLLGYNPNALGSALMRIKDDYMTERNNAIYFNSYSHPALEDRIANNGGSTLNSSKDFERIISFAVTNAAIMKYNNRRFRQCKQLVLQNIANGVATADDYILQANCLLVTSDTRESNENALKLIKIAQQLESNNVNIYKAEIIAVLRLRRYEDAFALLEKYQDGLMQLRSQSSGIVSERIWESRMLFITTEQSWAKNMIIKVKGLLSNKE